MTDVFLSYSHKDQAVTDRIVRALEAEGLSVWWDHTIPPGQTWDSFIAKGIVDARAVIVVWSRTSAASDWVKEEASIARTHGKYLPVQTDDAEPPIGFSRIQAAQLRNWTGDRSDPQWQMLVGEVRRIMEQPQGAAAQSQSHAPTPAASARRKKPGQKAPVGALVSVALLGLIVGAGAAGAGVMMHYDALLMDQAANHVAQNVKLETQIKDQQDRIAGLETRAGNLRNAADYELIDTVRGEMNDKIGELQEILDKTPAARGFVKPEVFEPIDWQTPVVTALNTRLALVKESIYRVRSSGGNIPAGSTAPPSFPGSH